MLRVLARPHPADHQDKGHPDPRGSPEKVRWTLKSHVQANPKLDQQETVYQTTDF